MAIETEGAKPMALVLDSAWSDSCSRQSGDTSGLAEP